MNQVMQFVCFTAYQQPNITTVCNRFKVKYYVYQQETCPESGRIHWQGYLELSSRQKLKAIRDGVFGQACHLERRMGTQEQAIAYCRKAESRTNPLDTPTEWGTKSAVTQGKRNDLDDMVESIKDGATPADIRSNNWRAYARAPKLCTELYCDVYAKEIPAWRNVHIEVIWGTTEMGKTRRCFDRDPELFKLDMAQTVWWDGYSGQQTLLIDDYYGWIPIGNMLNILDGYRLRLQIKGGFVQAGWTTVYITSNKRPQEWYIGNEALTAQQMAALMRRINVVTHATTEWAPPPGTAPAIAPPGHEEPEELSLIQPPAQDETPLIPPRLNIDMFGVSDDENEADSPVRLLRHNAFHEDMPFANPGYDWTQDWNPGGAP